MTGNGSAKKLPCNHIFHVSCLRSWFQRQQTCPTCRMDVLRNTNIGGENARGQPQPQQPQPGMANIPGIPAQFFIPPNWPPFAVPPQQAQQPPQQTNGQTINNNNINLNNNNNMINNNNVNANNANPNQSGANASQANRTSAPTGGQIPVPPFLFPPFLPYMAPPQMPTPPPNLSRLSLEELRTLEGNERQHIEARLKHLRNIQTLVDAALLQLQQYNQISSRWTASQSNTSVEPSAEATPSQPSTSSAAQPSPQDRDPSREDLLSTPQEVIRQRRLQRFSQTQAPVIDSSGAVTAEPTQSTSQTSDASHKTNERKE